MSQSTIKAKTTDAVSFVLFLFRWWKPLALVLLASALTAIIVSGFIKPKYKSTVVFFPTTTNSISKALLSDNGADKQDILEFGQEVEAEQILQILNSDNIRDKIVSKYDLLNHYEIDKDGSYPMTKLFKEYESNITFERTEFMSVKINVYDTDPQMAADIANNIGDYLDSMKTQVQRQRAIDGFKIVEHEYLKSLDQIHNLEDSLRKIRNRGVYDYEVQSKILNEEFAKSSSLLSNEKARLSVLEIALKDNDTTIINTKARIKGAQANMESIQTQLRSLAEFGGASVSISGQLELQQKQLSVLREKYEQARVDAEQNLPSKFIVNKATKAEKKTYPVRWLIVVLSMLGSLILCVLVLLGLDHYKDYTSMQKAT